MFIDFIKRILKSGAWIPFFFFAVYVAFPSRMYYSDGLDFAYFLERDDFGPEGFHPHHPLFLPITRLIYFIVIMIIPSLRAINFLALVASLSGAIGLWLFMRLLRSWGESRTNASIAIFFMGSVFAYWHFSCDANAYTTALAVALYGMVLVFETKNELSIKRALLIGSIFAIAIMIHEIVIFIAVSLLYYFYLERFKGDNQLRRVYLVIISFACVVVLISTINYALLSRYDASEITQYWVYLTSHARVRYFWTIINQPIAQVGVIVARSHTNLFFPLVYQELVHVSSVRGDTPTTFLLYRAFTALCAVISLITLFSIQKYRGKKRNIIRMIFFWAAIVFLFNFSFMPQNYFYRIFYLPPFIVILGEFYRFIISRSPFKPDKAIIAVAVGAYFIFNLTQGILWENKVDSNPFFYDTQRIDRLVSTKDIVVFPSDQRYRTKFYRYFGKGEALRTTWRIAYMDYWKDIYPYRDEYSVRTLDMLKSRYENIFIAELAWKEGEEHLLLGQYNFPRPRPRVMILDKEQLLVDEKHMGPDAYYYRINLNK